eukprot:SAG22_NODE_824_length_6981_cov_2.752833_3_plen_364_part_00
MATELPRQRPASTAQAAAAAADGSALTRGVGDPPVIIVPGEPKLPTTWSDTLWDYATSYLVLAVLVVFLVASSLETHHMRPNFVKTLAYVTGDAEMQYKLGAFYYHGMEGLPQDKSKAKSWLTAAAEGGSKDAALYLGHMHYRKEVGDASKTEAHKWLVEGAKRNSSEAQYKLGYLYYSGEGVPRNYQSATRYFRMAAERKHPGASSMLGYCYFKGRGLPTHNKLAMLWFRRAAEMGDVKAMLNLGVMHYRGKGTRKDPVLAYMWFDVAHKVGHDNQDDSYSAWDYMRRLVSKGKVNDEDIAEAIELGTEWTEKHGLLRGHGHTSNPPDEPPEGFERPDGTLNMDGGDQLAEGDLEEPENLLR